MILPRFELREPTSLGEACGFLQSGHKAKVMGGGTDLLVNMKKRVTSADVLVSLSKIPRLREMSFPNGGTLALGPMVTIAEIAESPLVRANFPALSGAASKLGSLQVRNRATVGGNVCTARPAGDTIGPLIAYGAIVEIASAKGSRTESIEKIFKGPGQTTIRSDEILTSITLSRPAAGTFGSSIKYSIRNAMDIAMVSVTCLLTLEEGVCRSARVVLGAVAPTFVRCPATEEFLIGKKITANVAEKAGQHAIDACSPITDMRASADYRRNLVQVLVKRCLMEAASMSQTN